LKDKILQLGAEFEPALMQDTTHLICGETGQESEKFKVSHKTLSLPTTETNNLQIRLLLKKG
jgi:hypothetical protein